MGTFNQLVRCALNLLSIITPDDGDRHVAFPDFAAWMARAKLSSKSPDRTERKLPGAINLAFYGARAETIPLDDLWPFAWHRVPDP